MSGRLTSHLVVALLLCAWLAPVAHTIWVSFSPDSFLTPPTGVWSGKWYRAFLEDHRWRNACGRSFVVAGITAFASVFLGALAALGAGQMKSRRSSGLNLVLLLPVLIPPAALGFGLLPVIHLMGLWGTLLGLILVNATLGLPIAFLIVRASLTDQLKELQAAAEGLGATRWDVLGRVTFPFLRPSLVAAGVAVFVLTLNESLICVFLATPTNETLPAVIWPQLRYSPNPLVAVASCVTAVVGLIGIGVALRLVGNRISAASSMQRTEVSNL